MEAVCIYARVSSDAQRKEGTIAAQLRDVPAFCVARGWQVVEQYVDDGRSGSTHLDKRLAFARLLADATAGRFAIVAVWSLDRLTRTADMRERGAILGALQAAGVRVAIASTGQILDLATDEGDLMGSFGAYSAAAENRRRRACTMAGRQTTIARGGKAQGETPYGLTYRKGDNHRGLAPTWGIEPHQARVVREIYQRVANGESTATIAGDLTRRGERRPRGGIWFDVQVRFVVTSPIYTGQMTACRRLDRFVPVPAIVDADLAAEARAVLADRYRRPPVRTRHHHLLSGLATCARCGATIGINSHNREGRPVHSYLCLGRRYSAGAKACDLPALRAAEVDARVWDALIDALGTEAVVERAIGRPAEEVDPGALERAEAELARIDGLQDAALGQLARGVLSQAVADRQVERLGRERREATAVLRAAQAASLGIRRAVDQAAVVEAVRLMRADAAHMDAAGRRELMRAAAARVSVGPDVIAIDLLIDARSVGLGEPACRSALAQPTPAGRLTVATPRRRSA